MDLLVNRLSGRIPSFLGNLTSLVDLSLENNMFSGTVPAELGKLVNLKTLVLSANNPSGELPLELNGLTNLTELKLSSNNFTGKIPSLGTWIQLRKLEIQGSGLEGPIPASISLLKNLTQLSISDLDGNSSQYFPDLSNITGMELLIFRSCRLTGSIPNFLSEMSKLRHLDLSFNNLEGDIPDLKELDLEKMYLTGNSLNGSIPAWINGGDTAHKIDLSYNKFNEESVPSYCRETLNLFRSYVPASNSELGKCLSKFPCLREYSSIRINCGGPKVTIGNLTYEADEDSGGAAKFDPTSGFWGTSSTGNALGGNHRLSNYVATNVSALTINDSQLYTTARLSPLSITYYGRCLPNGNFTVTLHFAEIVFRDNMSFQSLGRRSFDVYIQGVCIFKNFDIRKEAGGVDRAVIKEIKNVVVTNTTLEIRFQYAGKGTTAVPSRGSYGPLISAISMVSDISPPISDKSIKTIVIVAVAGIVCLIFIIFGVERLAFYMQERLRWERDLRGFNLQTYQFTYRQIRAATRNFSASNKLGQGGFGAVYRGTLSDGTIIAVKQLSQTSNQGNREFVNEIGLMTGIQHPNIVRLYGCCAESNHLMLVYEYMENNSLAQALYGHGNTGLLLDWPTRQNICVGVARGLAFLHEESILRMVHRDIKAANVLLDRHLTPKIADFGLAKLFSEDRTQARTAPAGTLGYMAPEYAYTGQLTYKVDVFSFGVLAMEIVTGTPNVYPPADDLEYLTIVHRATALQQQDESLIHLVDSRLGLHFDAEEALRMIRIALLCTNNNPNERPLMSEVVDLLQGNINLQDYRVRSPESPETGHGEFSNLVLSPETYHGEFWNLVLREHIEEDIYLE
ncbi:probable leucine-rich repeat receptor-like serine/threonine-protein kinase At3g14840 [Lactuca sativa]|uniref:probable leucine-rich repeat receptor-like serine/threonine-protein kinase At3g14840 n=1 Tax=Lactuca sativa TaxID=4236 RepID=UPI0022B04604|nr:probable leucine-rich repeat receptor-like serine/threonine-protein kinase At3g14840 [Lactuca sativa]